MIERGETTWLRPVVNSGKKFQISSQEKFQIGAAVADTSGHYEARGNSLESPSISLCSEQNSSSLSPPSPLQTSQNGWGASPHFSSGADTFSQFLVSFFLHSCISEEFIRQREKTSVGQLWEYAAALSPLLSSQHYKIPQSEQAKFCCRRWRMFDLMVPPRPWLESEGSEIRKFPK